MTYFEDLRVGTRTEVGSHTFTADEIRAFAREFDPQPFHLDEEAAAGSHFGALCASGWHTAAVCLRHVVLARQRRQAELRQRGEPVARTGRRRACVISNGRGPSVWATPSRSLRRLSNCARSQAGPMSACASPATLAPTSGASWFIRC